MPKITEENPEKLRPYLFHGVDLLWTRSDREATADCPWCGREGKFSVNIESGLWRCLVCNEGTETDKAIQGGNIYVFLRLLWERSFEQTQPGDYRQLLANRKLLNLDTLVQWQVCKSQTTGEWLVPGYSIEGNLTGLYKFVKTEKRWLLLPTPTLGLPLFGMNLFDRSKQTIFLCEGPWDGMALWEMLGQCKETEQGLKQTGNREASLLGDANVLAVAGTSAFYQSWLPLFRDKTVILMYDNDYPKPHPKNEGEHLPPAGFAAAERVSRILGESPNPPAEIHFLRWGEDGFDPTLPEGHDVRDYLNV